MNHYEYEINLFIDGELESEKQNELFVHLAECNACQKLLVDSLAIKEKARLFCAENLASISNKPKPISKLYKIGFYASSAAAILLLFVLTNIKPKEVLVTNNELKVDTVFVDKIVEIQPTNKTAANVGSKREKSISLTFFSEMKKMKSTKITHNDLIKFDVGS